MLFQIAFLFLPSFLFICSDQYQPHLQHQGVQPHLNHLHQTHCHQHHPHQWHQQDHPHHWYHHYNHHHQWHQHPHHHHQWQQHSQHHHHQWLSIAISIINTDISTIISFIFFISCGSTFIANRLLISKPSTSVGETSSKKKAVKIVTIQLWKQDWLHWTTTDDVYADTVFCSICRESQAKLSTQQQVTGADKFIIETSNIKKDTALNHAKSAIHLQNVKKQSKQREEMELQKAFKRWEVQNY